MPSRRLLGEVVDLAGGVPRLRLGLVLVVEVGSRAGLAGLAAALPWVGLVDPTVVLRAGLTGLGRGGYSD